MQEKKEKVFREQASFAETVNISLKIILRYNIEI